MVRNDFLDSMKAFTEDAVKDYILPVRRQDTTETQEYRCAAVYKMRLPDSRSAQKKAPYIIHQIVTADDAQTEGELVKSSLLLRSIFCVYSADEQEGALMLLELMERFRVKLLRTRVLDKRYALDLTASAMQSLIYPDDTAPYFAGEIATTWLMPAINREVPQWL